MATSPSYINPQPPSYITNTTNQGSIYSGNEAPTLCDIKIICTQRKKKNKGFIHLTFVESCPFTSSDDQPCIEILSKNKSTSISINDCISLEYFDMIKTDHQAFIHIYLESETISIHFSDEHIEKKPVIIKHLEYMYQKRNEKVQEMPYQDLPCFTTTEHILHTFDIKLIPYQTIITRDHHLVGPARLYFTTTDLYIASRDCNRLDLKTTISNQCPTKTNDILCIPYFTIKHYGNRSNIFLIELGKSNYGNGEIHMKCLSSALASTIHLLVSPVIEERPLAHSSAFRDRFLTRKRVEKSRTIHPPVPLYSDPLIPLVPLGKTHSLEPLADHSDGKKSRSIFGLFRKLVKSTSSLDKTCTFDNQSKEQQFSLQPYGNKYFAFKVDEKKTSQEEKLIIRPEISIANSEISIEPSSQLETTIGDYIDMGSTVKKSEKKQEENTKEEEIIREPTATVDMGVNTDISLSPNVYSVIIVGTSVHLLAEERTIFPIGQRSFTFPASVMQPFKAQLDGQTTTTTSTPLSSSPYQPLSPSDPQETLLLSYGIVTFDTNSSLNNQTNYASDGCIIDRRLNSDLSLMSLSRQEQPSNIFSFDNMLSSSTNSHICRTLSLSANNILDNTSGRTRASNASIIVFEENFPDQTTTYLLGPPPPPPPSTTFIDETIPNPISSSQLPITEKEKLSSNDCYALIEPLTVQVSSFFTSTIDPIKSSKQKCVHYTDIFLSTNTGDEHDDDLNDEKSERPTTLFYTDIDFHHTQRRHLIAQFTEISPTDDQLPPFVL